MGRTRSSGHYSFFKMCRRGSNHVVPLPSAPEHATPKCLPHKLSNYLRDEREGERLDDDNNADVQSVKVKEASPLGVFNSRFACLPQPGLDVQPSNVQASGERAALRASTELPFQSGEEGSAIVINARSHTQHPLLIQKETVNTSRRMQVPRWRAICHKIVEAWLEEHH